MAIFLTYSVFEISKEKNRTSKYQPVQDVIIEQYDTSDGPRDRCAHIVADAINRYMCFKYFNVLPMSAW